MTFTTPTTPTTPRRRSLIGSILLFLPGLALTVSGILKFAAVPRVVQEMARAGFAGNKLLLVASLEILAAALFLFRVTRPVGLLFLSAFFGGAICVHVQMGELSKGVSPSILLFFAWIGIWLRYPQALWTTKEIATTRNE